MKLEGKTAVITITKTYEVGLCDCCCDHPDDILNFFSQDETYLINEETKVKIKKQASEQKG